MTTRIILRLLPAAALAALVSACTGYAPPPYAQLSCMQQERFDAGADYLNCIRGYEQQSQPAPTTAQANAPAPTTAQASTPATTRAE